MHLQLEELQESSEHFSVDFTDFKLVLESNSTESLSFSSFLSNLSFVFEIKLSKNEIKIIY
jgi:hypothetical protein